MTPNPAIVKSVEQLGYRVTLGDVAAQAGLELNLAQQGLLALASDAGGHLQVSETGDIVYLFPRNFRAILRNKFWRLRLKETWEKVWNVLFYLIRISFGIVLVLSILLMMVAIALILIAISSSRDSDSNSGSGNSGSSGGGFDIVFLPNFFDLFWIFSPDYNQERYQEKKSYAAQSEGSAKEMNILEAIFSFLFGDGNPNRNLEERRWQEIGAVIRNNGGAVIAQQLAPYLDTINRYNEETEDYILPVLARFNGSPQVSPVGDIIYYFPELQVTANKRTLSPVATYLRENLWRFTQAGSGQIMLSLGLGALNFILALVLGSLLQGQVAAQLGGLVALVASIYWILLGYAIGFLGIPLIRYFWIQWSNGKISSRNQARQERVEQLNQSDRALRQKIDYARQFAAQKVITDADITYSTQTDLLEQEIQRSDQIDHEWQQRLQSGSGSEC